MRVWHEGGHLHDYLLSDDTVMENISKDALNALFDINHHFKNIDYIFERIFGSNNT
jgi:adenylosuccinate lyase